MRGPFFQAGGGGWGGGLNIQLVLNAGKHATGAERGKSHVRKITNGFRFASDWPRRQHIVSRIR